MTKQNFLFDGIENEKEYAEESYEDALNFKCKICGEKHDFEKMIIFDDGNSICRKHKE
jgi:hypothetical protein